MKGWRIRPATYGKEHFEVTILLLEIIYGFEIAVEIFALVIPRVTGVVYILVGPNVRENNLAGICLHVCKCIEDVSLYGVKFWERKRQV